MTPQKRKADTRSLAHWVALVGIEQGEWRVEAGDSLSGAPEDLDLEWLVANGRVGEATDGKN